MAAQNIATVTVAICYRYYNAMQLDNSPCWRESEMNLSASRTAARKPTEVTVEQLHRKSVVTASLSSDRRPSDVLPVYIA